MAQRRPDGNLPKRVFRREELMLFLLLVETRAEVLNLEDPTGKRTLFIKSDSSDQKNRRLIDLRGNLFCRSSRSEIERWRELETT